VSGGAVYVYGVAAAKERLSVSTRGVEAARIRTVEHDGLLALVSDVRDASLAAAREVRAHWRVLDEASESVTVLPVRFGTVMEDEDAVRARLLEPNAEHLRELLRELDGRVQLTLKGDYDEQLLMRQVVEGSDAVAGLRDRLRSVPAEAAYYERIRLGELVAAEVDHRRVEDTRVALETLEPLAVAAREEDPTRPDVALSLSFLVDRDRVPEFNDGVRKLAERFGERISLRYVGPLPPYSFADIELDPEAAAWA
jgi:Gas vesicle synthesis protein GvpL/GvpF